MSVRVVLDGFGGDHAPAEPVRGAVLAARAYGCAVTLVGPLQLLQTELAKYALRGLDLQIVDAPEVISMDEPPVLAVRRKDRSPHVVGLRMVRDGLADAFVSAGHSGATMAAATLILGRAEGVERPALAALFPTTNRPLLLLDVGATTDCKPEYLVQFAEMGVVYIEHVVGVRKPRVALLANGEENSKGDRLVQEAHALLRRSSLNFVGNAEPKDALTDNVCDVLVCDGFVGNMFIKTGEAVVRLAFDLSKREVRRGLVWRLLAGLAPNALMAGLAIGRSRWYALASSLVGGPLLLGSALVPPLLRVRKIADYRSYGGAPLLGLRGVAIVAHGRSDARAIMSAIRQAIEAVEGATVTGITDLIRYDGALVR